MYYLKKYIWIVLIIFVLLLFVFRKDDSTEEVILEKNNLELKEENIEEVTNIKIKVDIKGAVKNPGVYEVEENSRVSDVINISGGLTSEADTSVINLSKNVIDEMVIIIYTKDEINEMKEGSTSIKYIEKECICPKLENDACIEDKIDNIPNNENNSNDKNEANGKVSLNKATLDELMTLDGIGEKKAQAIIDYRNKNNGFKTIEELLEVDGIGSTTYEKIKDRLTL